MRITKRHLKRIIKEEKAKLIAEARIRKLVRRKLRENASDQLYFFAHPGGSVTILPLGAKYGDEHVYTVHWSEDVLYEDPSSNAQERAETFQKVKQTIEQYGDVLNGATYPADQASSDSWSGEGDVVKDFIFKGLTNGDSEPRHVFTGEPWASPHDWPALEQWFMTEKLEW